MLLLQVSHKQTGNPSIPGRNWKPNLSQRRLQIFLYSLSLSSYLSLSLSFSLLVSLSRREILAEDREAVAGTDGVFVLLLGYLELQACPLLDTWRAWRKLIVLEPSMCHKFFLFWAAMSGHELESPSIQLRGDVSPLRMMPPVEASLEARLEVSRTSPSPSARTSLGVWYGCGMEPLVQYFIHSLGKTWPLWEYEHLSRSPRVSLWHSCPPKERSPKP